MTLSGRSGALWVGAVLGVLTSTQVIAETLTAEAEAERAYEMAQSALQARAWAEAELYFERILMFNPEHAEARIQWAMLLAQRGKIETASGFIESLIEDPRTPPAHRQRLTELLSQLKLRSAVPVADSQPKKAPTAPEAALVMARFAVGYSRNPYARADINSLTLTLPDGIADLPVDQNIHPAPLFVSSLSYLAPNQCGFEVYDQRWGASEQHSAGKLLLFCYAGLAGQKVQTFASSLRSLDGNTRISAGLSWPLAAWRFTSQIFKEPQLERQGYGLRVDHLANASDGPQPLYYVELEKAATGVPGFIRSGFAREYVLTSGFSLLTQFSLQRDLGGYSALLEKGATRKLAFAELGLQRDWGNLGGWNVSASLHAGRRWSNLALFEFQDATLQLAFSRAL